MALARLNSVEAIPELIKDIKIESSRFRFFSIKALGFYRQIPENAFETLCNVVKDQQQDEENRIEAIKSLEKLHSYSGCVIEAMIVGLRDQNPDI